MRIRPHEYFMSQKKVLVTGAGGFIGHHLVTELKKKGYWVRGVDWKYPEFQQSAADEFELLDLRRWDNCIQATRGVDEVYALAADMGGMGFISCHHSEILHNNSLINIHTLEAARIQNVERYFYTSSACIYPEYKQTDTNVTPLKESDAYPAMPQDAYGWEKLIAEPLHALPGRLWYEYPYCQVPQYFRAEWNLDRWQGEGTGRTLPENRCGKTDRRSCH